MGRAWLDGTAYATNVRVALALGEVTEADVVAHMRQADASEAMTIAWKVASLLSETALVELAQLGRERNVRLDAVQQVLFDKGLNEAALAWPAARCNPDVAGRVAALPATEVTRAWLRDAVTALVSGVADTRADTIDLVERAPDLIGLIEPPERARICDALEARFRQELEAGCYEELDYAYGQVDPQLSMAATLLAAGETQRGLGHLAERHEALPKVFNLEELDTCGRLLRHLADDDAKVFIDRVAGWARARDGGKTGEHFVRWLVLRHARGEERATAALLEAASEEVPASAAIHVLQDGSLPTSVREAWLARAVDQLEAKAQSLVATPAGRVPKGGDVRAFRTYAVLVDAGADYLTDAQRERVAGAASKWAPWFATVETSDWLPYVFSCIALARHYRTEIAPALTYLRERALARAMSLSNYQGWETLFTPDVVRELVRT